MRRRKKRKEGIRETERTKKEEREKTKMRREGAELKGKERRDVETVEKWEGEERGEERG